MALLGKYIKIKLEVQEHFGSCATVYFAQVEKLQKTLDDQ